MTKYTHTQCPVPVMSESECLTALGHPILLHW